MEELLQSIKTLELSELCELLRELSSEISSRCKSPYVHKLEADQIHDKIFCMQHGMSCVELYNLFGDYGPCWIEHIDGSNEYYVGFVNKDDYLRAARNLDYIREECNKC